uniref:ABC transporter permease n=1 Tax=Ignisphaera aggregans TaxID=334771 RepID=A0A7J2U4I9_9CREN
MRGLVAKISLGIIFAEIFLALLANFIAPYPYYKVDLENRLRPPSPTHILGTDPLGRDVFSRLVYALRISFAVAILSLAVALLIGTVLGMVSAILGSVTDAVLSWIFDVVYAMPGFFIAIAILLIIGSGVMGTAAAISLTLTPIFFRLSRSATRGVLVKQYVEVAKALGASTLRIALNYVGRELMAVVIPAAVYMLSDAIALEATLSVVGLGVNPPTPSLGNMISEYKDYVFVAPWLVATPIAIIALTIASLNILAKELDKKLNAFLEAA